MPKRLSRSAPSDVPPKVGRCFHVRVSGDLVYVKMARDMGLMLYHLMVVSLRALAVDEPLPGDVDRLSLANFIESTLEIPANARVGSFTLPNTCEIEFLRDELRRYAAPELWEGWQPEHDFCEDFAELGNALAVVAEKAKCVCP